MEMEAMRTRRYAIESNPKLLQRLWIGLVTKGELGASVNARRREGPRLKESRNSFTCVEDWAVGCFGDVLGIPRCWELNTCRRSQGLKNVGNKLALILIQIFLSSYLILLVTLTPHSRGFVASPVLFMANAQPSKSQRIGLDSTAKSTEH